MKSQAYYEKRKKIDKVKTDVKKDPAVIKKIAPYQKIIESYGYA